MIKLYYIIRILVIVMKIHQLKKKNRFITTYIIAGGFLAILLVGTVLLCLPISSAGDKVIQWSDALFVSTSAVCVTGLSTISPYENFSLFGQVVMFFLMQIGGLGLITFTTTFLLFMKKRLGLREYQLIRDAYNLDTDRGMDRLIRRIFKTAFIIEGAGALLYCFKFVPEFGPIGIWKSVFNSVSAFCNAGFDILGTTSLIQYRGSFLVNIVTDLLILLGGLGFPVIFFIVDRIPELDSKKPLRKIFKLGLYEKVVLVMTGALFLGGAVAVFFMELTNTDTLANLPMHEKILASIFQSVTLRTAGFCTLPQEALRRSTMLVCCFFMFIGGSPSGTAGGIKTTTFLILAASLISSLSERNNTEIFCRKVNAQDVRRAMSVFMVSFVVMLISLTMLCIFQPAANFEDCVYEAVSSIATVGLSRNLTPSLTLVSKLVIVGTMYLGRIGPITLSLFFNTKKHVNIIEYPEESIPVG